MIFPITKRKMPPRKKPGRVRIPGRGNSPQPKVRRRMRMFTCKGKRTRKVWKSYDRYTEGTFYEALRNKQIKMIVNLETDGFVAQMVRAYEGDWRSSAEKFGEFISNRFFGSSDYNRGVPLTNMCMAINKEIMRMANSQNAGKRFYQPYDAFEDNYSPVTHFKSLAGEPSWEDFSNMDITIQWPLPFGVVAIKNDGGYSQNLKTLGDNITDEHDCVLPATNDNHLRSFSEGVCTKLGLVGLENPCDKGLRSWIEKNDKYNFVAYIRKDRVDALGGKFTYGELMDELHSRGEESLPQAPRWRNILDNVAYRGFKREMEEETGLVQERGSIYSFKTSPKQIECREETIYTDENGRKRLYVWALSSSTRVKRSR